jgi:hypothetical protein
MKVRIEGGTCSIGERWHTVLPMPSLLVVCFGEDGSAALPCLPWM